MDEELKKKAVDALKVGTDAAKRFGGKAYDLGKKGYEAAREKAKEIGDKVADSRRLSAQRAANRPRDPEDRHFPMSDGGLYLLWWIGNILYSILCLKWFASAADSYFARDTAWVPLVLWPIILLLNRLFYEAFMALFELVKHLRQIRDELSRRNGGETGNEDRVDDGQVTDVPPDSEGPVPAASGGDGI